MNRQEQFSEIYQKNLFRGSVSKSGNGSDLVQTEKIRSGILKLFQDYSFSSLLDAPCGDFYWMQYIYANIPNYIGADIVPALIEDNKKKYPNKEFRVLDIVTDPLPTVDVMLCRDCLVHMSFATAKAFLKNFINSDIKYLLTTTFTNVDRINTNFEGLINWYPITLIKPPFNLPLPELIINEGCTECNNEYTDKSLGLWTKEQIKYAMEL